MDEYGAAEQRILEAARLGEMADFRDPDDPGAAKEAIDAQFLADLWAGWIEDVIVHPRGLRLAGIQIEGDLDVHSNPHREGFATLAYLELLDCECNGLFNISSCTAHGLRFENTRFGVGQATHVTDYLQSIEANSCHILTNLMFKGCYFTGVVELSDLVTGQHFDINNCTFEQPLYTAGGRIGANFTFQKSKFAGGGLFAGEPFTISGDCTAMEVAGELSISKCSFKSALGFSATSMDGFSITHSRFESASEDDAALNFNGCRITALAAITRTYFDAGLACNGTTFHGGLTCRSSIFKGGHERAEMDFSLSTLSRSFHIENVRAEAGLRLDGTQLEGPAILTDSAFSCIEDGQACFNTYGLTCTGMEIQNCRFSGVSILNGLKVSGFLSISQSSFVSVAAGNANQLSASATQSNRLDGSRVNLSSASLGSGASIHKCFVMDGMSAGSSISGASMDITQCLFLGRRDSVSLNVQATRAEGRLLLRTSHFSSGLYLYATRWTRLDVEGCTIDSHEPDNGLAVGMWCDDIQLDSDFTISSYTENGRTHMAQLCGGLLLHGAKLGGGIQIDSSNLALAQSSIDEGFASAVNARKASIGGSVIIGRRPRRLNVKVDTYRAPVIHGALELDDSNIGGDLVVHEAQIRACGEVRRPSTIPGSEERVSQRKRGVALSLQDASVAGELHIGHGDLIGGDLRRHMFSGLVDLRNASVKAIVDGAGCRWEEVGLRPGNLLLEGLTYQTLDNSIRGQTGEAGLRNIDAANRRLDWLAMQYPDREPDPQTFVPQPYEQLASIFTAGGNERARRKVQVQKRNLQRKYGGLGGFERSMQWFLMALSNYGYSPARALFWTLVFVGIGTAATYALEAREAFILSSIDGQPDAEFSAFVYALDSAIPIIDLNQDSGWTIDPAALPTFLPIEPVLAIKALYEIVGMLLVSVTVLTLTGTLREKD